MMKMRVPLAVSLACLVWSASICGVVLGGEAATLDERAVAILTAAIEADDLVGLSAGISVKGKIVWSGGAGYADLENELPARAEMVHRIASITKPQTAVAVMQLVEAGKVVLEAELSDYITFPEKPWPVQIRQVLAHTSGIRHYKVGSSRTMTHYPTLVDAMEVFKDDPLRFEPDTAFGYTTFGYVTLGAVIEAVSGQTYGDYMGDHVWGPAGMESTRLEVRGEVVPRRARGYALYFDREIVNARYSDLSMKYPGGGILSTVGDLLRFVEAFESGRLVSAKTRARMLTSAEIDGKKTQYGLGWDVREDSLRGPLYTHSGGQAGTSTLLIVFRDHDVAVAVISNREGWRGINHVAGQLADLVIE